MISTVLLADIARLFSHLREAGGQNLGLRVRAVQQWSHEPRPPEPWCCDMATMWLDLKFGGASPVVRTASCDEVYEQAQANGWLRDTPQVDDLVLYMRDPDGPAGPVGFEDAHHIALVTNVGAGGFTAIAGNTSEDGTSDNGDRVAERPVPFTGPTPKYKFVRYPKPWLT